MQHTLNLFDLPILEAQAWEMLENEPRTVATVVLARLMVKAVCAPQTPEEDHD